MRSGPQPGAAEHIALERMVHRVAEEVRDRRVLDAMRAVPRAEFVPAQHRAFAYEDGPLPIGEGQTISQPLIVGLMTEALRLTGTEHVLEVGTGSGYQAAVLARLARDVVSVEIVASLRGRAAATLARLEVRNVLVLPPDAEGGAAAHAPYDAIIVTAAAPAAPPALLAQLRIGGRMVIPAGTREQQELLAIVREADHLATLTLGGARFVPLLGPGGFGDAPRPDPAL